MCIFSHYFLHVVSEISIDADGDTNRISRCRLDWVYSDYFKHVIFHLWKWATLSAHSQVQPIRLVIVISLSQQRLFLLKEKFHFK